MLFGLANAVQELLLRLQTIAWNRVAAKGYGVTRAMTEKQGNGIGNLDLLIAAHTISIDATLVFNDQAFSRVPNLKVQDWTR